MYQSLFLQAAPGAGVFNLVLPILIIVVFYFFMVRPQQKKQKEQLDFQAGLSKGSRVVTASGMFGTISKVEEKIITLQVDAKTFVRMTRGSISKELTEGMADENTEI